MADGSEREGRPDQYILLGRIPIPEYDLFRWGQWMATADRRVRQTKVGCLVVSTVFLGLDHGLGGPPLLFETMVYKYVPRSRRHKWTFFAFQERYSTWEQSEAGHCFILPLLHQVRSHKYPFGAIDRT